MFKSWQSFFDEEIHQEYYINLMSKVNDYYEKDMLFPAKQDLFNAFNYCDFKNLKVVIIGQDPYHNDNQSMGLPFSVRPGIKTPPSLKNIFKEIQNEYGYTRTNTNLSDWCEQGVLLINTTLTVIKHQPLSCKNWGWEIFTKHLFEYINNHCSNICFVCWGNHALSVMKSIQLKNNNVIISTAHPSPLSASRGFLNSNVFRNINDFLALHNKKIINW